MYAKSRDIQGWEIFLRMASSRCADDDILDAGASSVASKLTTLMANSSESAVVESTESSGVARTTLEKAPRPRDWVVIYRRVS